MKSFQILTPDQLYQMGYIHAWRSLQSRWQPRLGTYRDGQQEASPVNIWAVRKPKKESAE